MLTWFRQKAHLRGKASELYGAVVAQARRSEFYGDGGIPDTAEGRYELIVLHLFLVLERLKREASQGANLSRYLIEGFVTDMDDNMREMGVGDLTVPKKVKRAAAGLYERSVGYRNALAGDDAVLASGLRTTLLGTAGGGSIAETLAVYVRSSVGLLDAQPAASLLSGQVTFPVPVLPVSTRT